VGEVGRVAAALPTSGLFDSLEQVFWSLRRGPSAPLVLRGRWLQPRRRRPVGLAEARELLLWPGRMDPDRRDRVWAAARLNLDPITVVSNPPPIRCCRCQKRRIIRCDPSWLRLVRSLIGAGSVVDGVEGVAEVVG
jgi:hypothetical protein